MPYEPIPQSLSVERATAAWPLRFTYRGPVLGNGFIALVELSGRLLARLESEGIWTDGVNPGGFALGAPTLAQASQNVTDTLAAVLFDLARDADSFDDFKAAIERFFEETDDATIAEWTEAVARIRSGHVAVPADLPIQQADEPFYARVIRRSSEQVTARDNPERRPVLAGAA